MTDHFLRRSSRAIRRLGFRDGVALTQAILWRGGNKQNCERQLSLHALPHPTWMRMAGTDLDCFEHVFVHRQYDFSMWPTHHAAVSSAYADCLSRGDVPVIVDCGANVGFASIWFALRYPKALIYAVEPEPNNFAILARNVASYPNIVPIRAAISDRAVKMSLRNPTDTDWAYQTEEDPNGLIEAVTVPDLIGRQPNARPFIIKVDIEGHETALFRSNTEWVRSASLVVFEMHDWLFHWRGTGHAVLQCLTQEPRDYLMRGENVFSFLPPTKSREG